MLWEDSDFAISDLFGMAEGFTQQKTKPFYKIESNVCLQTGHFLLSQWITYGSCMPF